MFISPNTSPTSRPLSRTTHQAPGPPEVCDGDCHCHNTYVYISKGLFNLHGPPGRERLAGVPCGSVSCTVVERQERAHTDTKEGKTQANHGFFVVLAYFWQRSEADVPWGQCGICSCDVRLVKTVCHGMMWFLASAGWVLLLLLLLLRCAVLLLVVGCCQLLLVCWRWLATILLVSCCWLGAACCLAAAGLLLPACCCCLAAAGYLLLLLGCWCCFAAGWLLLAAAAAAACATKPTHLLLAVVAQTLSLWQCPVVNWAWKAWFWLTWPVW